MNVLNDIIPYDTILEFYDGKRLLSTVGDMLEKNLENAQHPGDNGE